MIKCLTVVVAVLLAPFHVQAGQVASVKLLVVVSDGVRLQEARITLHSPSTSYTAVKLGGSVMFESVPYDRYELTIESSGFERRQLTISVNQPKIALVLGLDVALLDIVPGTVAGRVVGGAIRKDTWIRLVPLFSTEMFEDAVDRSGAFSVRGVRAGKYVAVVFDETGPLASKVVDVGGADQKLEIGLGTGVIR